MWQLIEFFQDIFIHTNLPKAFQNPWLVSVIIIILILAFIVIFVDKDFNYLLYSMGSMLRVLFKASP